MSESKTKSTDNLEKSEEENMDKSKMSAGKGDSGKDSPSKQSETEATPEKEKASPGDARTSGPGDATSAGDKSVETSTAKATGDKSVEGSAAKPTGDKSVENSAAKPTGDKTVESSAAKPTRNKSVESSTVKPTGDKSVEGSATKPTGDKTVESSATKPTRNKSVESSTVKPTGDKSVEGSAAKPTGDKPVESSTTKPATAGPGKGSLKEKSPDAQDPTKQAAAAADGAAGAVPAVQQPAAAAGEAAATASKDGDTATEVPQQGEGVDEAEEEEQDSSSTAGGDGEEKPPADAAAKAAKQRATRSRNPEFAAKQKSFIKDYKRSVGEKRSAGGESGVPTKKRRRSQDAPASGASNATAPLGAHFPPEPDAMLVRLVPPAPCRPRGGSCRFHPLFMHHFSAHADLCLNPILCRLSTTWVGSSVPNDNFCWVCHRDGRVVCCETCPRVFHLKCAGLQADPPGDWVCVECRRVLQAETVENLSPAMKMLTHERFTLLLKHAIGRLKGLPGAEPFITPVDPAKFPSYGDVVACPMDLSTMEENLERGMYGSTEAFVADCKWILHNCILFNGTTSKLTGLAKSLLRMCKWEMEEIETCPDCYSNAYNSDNWFTEACPHPHLLIWARLKGFPYWPAKAVKSKDGNVDCRFFGRHDRAWVPIKECFLFSKEPPSPPKNRSKSLDASIEELEEHVRNLEAAFGKFAYPKPRTLYDPRKIRQHLRLMVPGYSASDSRPDQEKQKRKSSGSSGNPAAPPEKQQKSKKSAASRPADAPQPMEQGERPLPEKMPAKLVKSEGVPAGAEKKAAEGSARPAVAAAPAAAEPQHQPASPQQQVTPQPAAVKTRLLKVPAAAAGAVKVLPASAVRALPVVQTPQGTIRKVIKLDGTPVNMQQMQLVVKGQPTPTARPKLTATRANGNGQTPPAAVGRPRAAAPPRDGSPSSPRGKQPAATPRAAPSPLARAASDGAALTISTPTTIGPMMIVPGKTGGSGGGGRPDGVEPGEPSMAAEVPATAAEQQHTPGTAQLAQQSSSLTELIRGGLERAISEVARAGAPASAVSALRLQIDRLQWRHQMELAEQRKVTETMLAELRNSMDIEQKKEVNKLTGALAEERAEWARQTELRVAETKRRQWCAACGKEAIFYCCWNTSYCDFPCQEAQWPKHMLTCANQQGAEEPPPADTAAPAPAPAAADAPAAAAADTPAA